jgi:pyruvate kinase
MLRAMRPTRALGRYVSNMSATKIVATIGPASEHMPMLQHVVDAGLKIMRINFSHATYEEADLRTTNIRMVRVGGK